MASTSTTTATKPTPPRVPKTSLHFKSDVRKSQLASHPRGILHAERSTPSNGPSNAAREEHTFAWIDNYNNSKSALGHLGRYGFVASNVQFIPYSSKAAWVTKYPHAFPYVHCDALGNVTGYPYWSPRAGTVLDIPPEIVHVATRPTTDAAIARGGAVVTTADYAVASSHGDGRGKRHGSKLLSDAALLTNSERHKLHDEIYNYFSWLTNQVVELDQGGGEEGRKSVRKANLDVVGLQGLLVKFEKTFDSVRALKRKKASEAADGGGAGVAAAAMAAPPPPLLEGSLQPELSNLLAIEDEERKKKIKAEVTVASSSGGSPGGGKKSGHWEPLDFDAMFAKLVTYKAEHGHPNVPVKYQKDVQLGSWVSGLRTKKKAYDRDGESTTSMDLDEEGMGGIDSLAKAAASTTTQSHPAQQKYLTPERIQRLESIGFSWSMMPSRPKAKSKSWDERLADLKSWHDERGTFKVPRTDSLGEWVHNQRSLYSKRDAKFMAKKLPRMEEIGYKFDVRENGSVRWDDRFEKLVEHYQEHGNFNIPRPKEGGEDDDGMYKWVNRLHNEYRAYEKGTQSKLNDDRVQKLKSINFKFKGPKNRGRPKSSTVPNVPWEKRIQQLESYKADTGHLNIDHNYRHCSNLGGWAADMSKLHKNWKSGNDTQQLSDDMIAKFEQLTALGFQFNVLPYYENNRSWDEHYDLLLKYKEDNDGSCRVPLKYKADLRLGKWVQTQRQQRTLLSEGKESKLTEERVQKLESAGFEWEVPAESASDVKDEEEVDNAVVEAQAAYAGV